MSEKDFLTGCLSKETINSTLDKIKSECRVHNVPFSVLVIDLDHFKAYNDKYGHIDGDEALKYFASTLRLSLREEEVSIFRFGGDEFIIVFARKSGRETRLITNKVIKNLKRRPFLSGNRTFKLHFSAGIASYPSDGNEIEMILQKADKAMYFSKTHGRGKVILHSHILRKTIGRALSILISILFVAAMLYYFNNSFYKNYAVDWLKRQTIKVNTVLTSVSVKVDNGALDLVYLKSGRIIKGVVVHNDKDEIELSLNLERGEGLIKIKKTEIEKIKMHSKETVSSQNDPES